MNRWPLLAVVTVLAALAGAYAFYARHDQLNASSLRAAEAELDVEEFDSEDVRDEDTEVAKGPLPRDAPGEAQSQTSSRPLPRSMETSQIETIDDEDMLGETVEEPLLIEDEDENGTLENVLPSPSRAEGTAASIDEQP